MEAPGLSGGNAERTPMPVGQGGRTPFTRYLPASLPERRSPRAPLPGGRPLRPLETCGYPTRPDGAILCGTYQAVHDPGGSPAVMIERLHKTLTQRRRPPGRPGGDGGPTLLRPRRSSAGEIAHYIVVVEGPNPARRSKPDSSLPPSGAMPTIACAWRTLSFPGTTARWCSSKAGSW